MTRIAPIEPPFSPENQKMFDLVMPDGMEPLELFRVLARSERIFPRFMRAGVLDPGPVPIRDREIVIHRTTALCSAEYEWGVHVTAFGRPLGLGEEVLAAIVNGAWDDPAFDARQQSLVRMCDEFHRTSDLSDDAYRSLQSHFDETQLIELIYTVGMYHAVSFLCRGLRLAPEKMGARFEEFSATSPA